MKRSDHTPSIPDVGKVRNFNPRREWEAVAEAGSTGVGRSESDLFVDTMSPYLLSLFEQVDNDSRTSGTVTRVDTPPTSTASGEVTETTITPVANELRRHSGETYIIKILTTNRADKHRIDYRYSVIDVSKPDNPLLIFNKVFVTGGDDAGSISDLVIDLDTPDGYSGLFTKGSMYTNGHIGDKDLNLAAQELGKVTSIVEEMFLGANEVGLSAAQQ